MIRKATEKDIPHIVAIHQLLFADDFFSKLGSRILSLLYRDSVYNDFSLIYVIERNKNVAGFIKVTTGKKRLTFSNSVIFFVLLIHSLFRNPAHMYYVMQFMMYVNKWHNTNTEIVSLGILPDFQNKRFGTELVHYVENILQKKDIDLYCVMTQSDNKQANSFYKKMNFQFVHEFKLFGKKRNLYEKKIPKKQNL